MIKEKILTLLRSTERDGIEDLIEYMEKSGFFEAPASTKFHGATEGALAVHSLNVCNTALEIAETVAGKEWFEDNKYSVIIAALLHDLGKAGQFGKPLYVENILKKGRSEAQPYKTNDELKAIAHEITSIVEAEKRIHLTEDEQFAILFHNGLYTSVGRYDLQGKETPLQMIIHFADLWCSRVTEKGEEA